MKLTINTDESRAKALTAANEAASNFVSHIEDNFNPEEVVNLFASLLAALRAGNLHQLLTGQHSPQQSNMGSPALPASPGLPSASAGTSHEVAAIQILLGSELLSPGYKIALRNLLAAEGDPARILVDATTGELLAVKMLQGQVNTAKKAAKEEIWNSVQEDLSKIDTALGGVTSKWGSSEVTGKDAVTAAINVVRTKLQPDPTS